MKYSCCTCKLNEFASLSTSEISLLVFTGVFFLVVIWLECFVFSNTLPADNGLLGWIQFITSWCRDRLQGFTFIYGLCLDHKALAMSEFDLTYCVTVHFFLPWGLFLVSAISYFYLFISWCFHLYFLWN